MRKPKNITSKTQYYTNMEFQSEEFNYTWIDINFMNFVNAIMIYIFIICNDIIYFMISMYRVLIFRFIYQGPTLYIL